MVLRQSEQRFADFAEASADWVWETDAEARFTYMSSNIERILGVKPEWHYGKTREDILGDTYDHDARDHHRDTLQARRPFRDFVYRRGGKSVEPQWLRSSGIPKFGPDGTFRGYRGTVSDVTVEIEAQRAVTRSGDELRLITDNLPALVAVLDRERRFVFANETAAAWYARPIGEILGKTVAEVVGEAASALYAPMHDQALGGETATFTGAIDYPDGKTREVMFSYVPRYGEDGAITHFIALGHDVTHEKQAEERMRVSEARLQQAVQLTKIGYYVWDTVNGRCHYCSEQHARTYGVTVQQFMERASLEMIHPGGPGRVSRRSS